jgi:hypothetical protein
VKHRTPPTVTLSMDGALTQIQSADVDQESGLSLLCVVHPIGGEPLLYRGDAVPLLGLSRPVDGFGAVSLDGREVPFVGLVEMAHGSYTIGAS